MTTKPIIRQVRTLPNELIREIENAHTGLAGQLAEALWEQTRAAYAVGYERGWQAGYEAAEEARP